MSMDSVANPKKDGNAEDEKGRREGGLRVLGHGRWIFNLFSQGRKKDRETVGFLYHLRTRKRRREEIGGADPSVTKTKKNVGRLGIKRR